MERDKKSNLVQGAADFRVGDRVKKLYYQIDQLMRRTEAQVMAMDLFSRVEADDGWSLACYAKNPMTEREAAGIVRRLVGEFGLSVRLYMGVGDSELGADDCYMMSSVDDHQKVYLHKAIGGIDVIR